MLLTQSASCLQRCIRKYSHQDTTIDETSQSDTASGLIDKVMDRATTKDVMVKSMSKANLSKGIHALTHFSITEESLITLLSDIKALQNLDNIKMLIESLTSYGIVKQELADVCSKCPELLHQPYSHISDKINELQKCGFPMKTIAGIIQTYPAVLIKDVSQVKARIEELKAIFKTADTLKLLEKSPKLLFCDMSYIHDRFNYVYYEMGILQPQMVRSGLFNHPVEHIHARHMFLVRAGFFQKIKRKKGQLDNNPRLDVILDTTDKEFVERFGGMTLLDYLTFKKLLLRENYILKEQQNDYEVDW